MKMKKERMAAMAWSFVKAELWSPGIIVLCVSTLRQRRESRKIEEMLIVTAPALADVDLGLKILIAPSGFICAPQQ